MHKNLLNEELTDKILHGLKISDKDLPASKKRIILKNDQIVKVKL